MPLTLNEVQADKDQQRAEFAITLRKAEIKAKSVQEKLTEQRADAAVHRDKSRVLEEERKVQAAELVARAASIDTLKDELEDREKDIGFLGTVRSDLESQITNLNTEIEKRDQSISELEIDSDNRRIELVAKVTEQDQLNGRLRDLNLTRKSLEEKLRLTALEMRKARETSRAETKRLIDLERKTERFVTQLSDREERLERREKELLRTKDSLKASLDELSSVKRHLLASSQRNQQLERDSAKVFDQKVVAPNLSTNAMVEKTMKKLEDDKARLLVMVRQLNQEKDALVQKLNAASNIGVMQGNTDAVLRSQVHDLTAKIVTMTAESEGAKSPIARLLQTAPSDASLMRPKSQPQLDTQSNLPESLADRIKALQKSARGG